MNTLTSSFSACEKQTESEWILSHLPSLLVRNKLNLSEYSHIFLLCLWDTNWRVLSDYSHIFRLLFVRNKLNLSEYSHIFLLCLWDNKLNLQVNTLTSSFYACEKQTDPEWILSHLPSLPVRNKLNLSEYSHIFLLCLWDTNWVQVTTLTSSFSACEKQTDPEWILSHLPSMLVRNKLSPEWILSHLPSLLVRNKLNLSEYSHIFRLCLWDTNWVQVTTFTSSFYVCKKQTEPEWILSHLPSLPVRNKLSLSDYSHFFLPCLWETNLTWVNTLTSSVSACAETNWVWVNTLTSSFSACEKQTEPEWILSHLPSLLVRNKLSLSEYFHIFLLCLWETNWTWVNTLTSSVSACEKQTESEWLFSLLPSLLVRNKLIWVNTLTSSFYACAEINWIWVNTLTSSFSACEKQTEPEWILSHLPSLPVRNKLNLTEYSHIFLLCLWETNWVQVTTLTSSVSACEKQTDPEWILSHLPSVLVRNKLNLSEYSHIFRLCLWETNWVWVNTLTSSFYACEKQTESEWILSHLPSMLVRYKLSPSDYSHIFRLCL